MSANDHDDDQPDSEDVVEKLRARVAKLEAATQGMLDEWDNLTRYGSPMAKAANERVAFARAALSSRERK